HACAGNGRADQNAATGVRTAARKLFFRARCLHRYSCSHCSPRPEDWNRYFYFLRRVAGGCFGIQVRIPRRYAHRLPERGPIGEPLTDWFFRAWEELESTERQRPAIKI